MEVERGEETEESTQEPATDREPEASSLERSGEEEERSQEIGRASCRERVS